MTPVGFWLGQVGPWQWAILVAKRFELNGRDLNKRSPRFPISPWSLAATHDYTILHNHSKDSFKLLIFFHIFGHDPGMMWYSCKRTTAYHQGYMNKHDVPSISHSYPMDIGNKSLGNYQKTQLGSMHRSMYEWILVVARCPFVGWIFQYRYICRNLRPDTLPNFGNMISQCN